MERSGNFYKAIRLGYILISILIGCVLSVALSGLTVTLRVLVSPSFRVMFVSSSSTELTATVGFFTVTLQVDDLPPAVALMSAVPSALPVTRPVGDTVATVELDVDQVIVLSVALDGLTVALN